MWKGCPALGVSLNQWGLKSGHLGNHFWAAASSPSFNLAVNWLHSSVKYAFAFLSKITTLLLRNPEIYLCLFDLTGTIWDFCFRLQALDFYFFFSTWSLLFTLLRISSQDKYFSRFQQMVPNCVCFCSEVCVCVCVFWCLLVCLCARAFFRDKESHCHSPSHQV